MLRTLGSIAVVLCTFFAIHALAPEPWGTVCPGIILAFVGLGLLVSMTELIARSLR